MDNEYYSTTVATCADFSFQDRRASGWVGGREAPDFVSSISGGATQFCDLQMREGIAVKHNTHWVFMVMAKQESKWGQVSWSFVNNLQS